MGDKNKIFHEKLFIKVFYYIISLICSLTLSSANAKYTSRVSDIFQSPLSIKPNYYSLQSAICSWAGAGETNLIEYIFKDSPN